MKNRVLFLPGMKRTIYRNTNNPALNFERYDVVSNAYADIFTVTNDTVHGDHKTPNNHGFTKLRRKMYNGSTITDVGFEYTQSEGDIRNYTAFPTAQFGPLSDIAYNSALSRLYEQIRGKADLSVDAFQLRQSAKMIRGVTSLLGFVRKFKPSEWKNTWLEVQYGWRPSVAAIYDSLDSLMGHTYSFQRMRASATEIRNGREDRDFGSNLHEVSDWTTSVRCRVVGTYQIKPTVWTQLANYTSLNPVSIAWELLPYSFVVDWVYDVGGYLRNLENALLYDQSLLHAYYTITGSHQTEARYTQTYTPPGTKWIYSQKLAANSREIYKSRVKVGSLVPRPPRFEVKIGWERAMNGAALLAQHLGVKR